jgi:hypothetical protein
MRLTGSFGQLSRRPIWDFASGSQEVSMTISDELSKTAVDEAVGAFLELF